MKYFDSHCHIDMEPLSTEQEAVIERAFRAGVSEMVNVGSSIRGSRESVELAERFPNVWASVGLHPHDAEAVIDLEPTIEELEVLAQNKNVVAIGEIGLDYFYLESKDLIPAQKELFKKQLELAKKLKKPVIIHIRDAWDDAFQILENWKPASTNRNSGRLEIGNSSEAIGVVHCFTGGPSEVKKVLDLGFYVGFTGFVTFDQPKFDHIRESVKLVPLEKLLAETDAPFLAPDPYRGKTNEPAYVVEVVKKLAELKGVSVEEMAKKTRANAKKLFDLE